ncbi:MAG TPA: hypothetical protein VNK95_13770, partial [Caldilineaceae bacterium]|nr:hypothetical protein [Caldilineaceae bacterium]
MSRLRALRADLLALLVLLALPLLWFAPVLVPALSGRTLLPFDNLYSFEPWRSMQPGLTPHNGLLSDLVLENAVWKLHIRRTLAAGELPLWNPQIFTGLPFLAAGQASTFYPLSALFLLLPLTAAYGWFTALQLGLAGANLYLLGRALGLGVAPALFGGVVYMFSGFLIASVVFTMFIAAAAWLPLILAVIEWMARKQEEKGLQGYNPTPYVVAGAVAIGCMVLAGHPELIYYTLLVAALFTVVRLGVVWRRLAAQLDRGQTDRGLGRMAARRLAGLAGWLLGMAVLGVAIGGAQLLPLLELVPLNFREGSASYTQVVGWAWPTRHVLTFWLPDVFGNPSHHAWLDIWQGRWTPVTVNTLGEPVDAIFWGIKNYVEGANYLGVLTWLLAAVAVGYALRRAQVRSAAAMCCGLRPWAIWFCVGLAAVSLLFAFGTPLYALLFYGLPGWNQLHSPFRWVFPYTLCMALLGAMGLHLLPRVGTPWSRRVVRGVAGLALLAGGGALALVLASLIAPGPFQAFGQRLVESSDLAQMAFADGRMFWSYQALNLARFGLLALAAGGWLWLATPVAARIEDAGRAGDAPYRRPWATRWAFAAVALVTLDLYLAHGGFNPAAPTALSPLNEAGTPSVVSFLNKREPWPKHPVPGRPLDLWRFTTFNAPGEKTFNANVGMYYGWHDLRGYDSIIPRQ